MTDKAPSLGSAFRKLQSVGLYTKTEHLENKYDTFMPVLTNLIDSVEKFNSIYNNYIELKNFYGSEKWFEYMEIEKIPVKCGVLTEDQLFDMIGDHSELLGVLLDLTSKMYKNF